MKLMSKALGWLERIENFIYKITYYNIIYYNIFIDYRFIDYLL